jgi:stearoyl-CoA desaturase (delta-9 desaturase)
MGLYEGQPDVGWWVLLLLRKLGLVWDVKLPQDLPFREELKPISTTRKTQVEYSQSNL